MEIVPAESSEKIDERISKLYLGGMSREEIGKKIGLSTGTVGARIGRMFKAGTLEHRHRIPRHPPKGVTSNEDDEPIFDMEDAERLAMARRILGAKY